MNTDEVSDFVPEVVDIPDVVLIMGIQSGTGSFKFNSLNSNLYPIIRIGFSHACVMQLI